jgi:Flp pilus assembly protein TadD
MARAILCEYLGRLHVGMNDLAKAEGFLRRAVALDPEGVDHYVQLANCLCLSGRDEEAWQLSRQLYQRFPDHPVAIHYLGKMLDDRGQHAQGLALMKRAIHLDPNNGRMLADLAFSYLRQGKAGAAMVCCEQAMTHHASDEVVHFVHSLVAIYEKRARARKSRAHNRTARRQRKPRKSPPGQPKRETK